MNYRKTRIRYKRTPTRKNRPRKLNVTRRGVYDAPAYLSYSIFLYFIGSCSVKISRNDLSSPLTPPRKQRPLDIRRHALRSTSPNFIPRTCKSKAYTKITGGSDRVDLKKIKPDIGTPWLKHFTESA